MNLTYKYNSFIKVEVSVNVVEFIIPTDTIYGKKILLSGYHCPDQSQNFKMTVSGLLLDASKQQQQRKQNITYPYFILRGNLQAGSFPKDIIACVASRNPLRLISIIRPTSGMLIVSLFQRGLLFHPYAYYAES